MAKRVSRRQFVQASTAGLAVAAARPAFGRAPAVQTGGVKPVIVASSNGNRYKNGGPVTGVQKAFDLMTKGSDVLDAVVAGVNLCELDPEDSSVGFGGLPNAEGVVQLDSCCMHGPTRRAGGVACIEGVRTPSLVAKAVLEQTDHHLIVGKDAQAFARGLGFKIEDDLNTEHSRKMWLEWKRRIDPEHYYGTINMDGVNAKGEVCGVTTTSGLSWKIPGRVGDSPILGAGLYVDGEIGAAGSTGRGEANLYNLCSYLIVEEMRRGRHPKDAGMEALKRVQKNTVEKRLLNSRGFPNFGLNFYILNAKGEYAGVSMYEANYAVCTEKGPETLPTTPLLQGKATG